TPNGAWVKESAITKAVYASTATGAGIGFLRVPDSEAKFEFYTDNTKTTKLFTVIVKHDSEATDVVDDDAEYKHRYNPKTERIEFVKVDEDGEMTDELVDINGAWFYALKYNAAKASKTKWIPVYGSSIDVSKLIKKEVTIPLVSAANVTKVTDSPAETVVIPLKIAARDAGPGKGAASYASNGELKVPKGHDWRVGNGAWISVGDTDLTRKFEATDFPYGSIIEVRKSATATVAASLKVQKVKVAGQPAQPKVDIDSGKAYIKGFKDTMEITFAGSTELKDGIQVQKWISGPSKADNKQEKWEELIKDAVVNEGTTDKVDVRIRVKEGKKPYSVEKVLTLTKGTPAASQADVGPVESAAAAAGNDTVTVAITAPTTGSPAFKAGTTPGAVDKANFEVKKGTSELAPTAYTASLIDGKVVIKLNTPLLVDETMTITAKKEAFTDAAIVTAISVTLSTATADPEP
ncbi:MAG: hypothetical protein FWH10_04745, partial [Oscillospiraceae bacterium]|nr:hypothetical protein [Oscillospiraceae bacterium]